MCVESVFFEKSIRSACSLAPGRSAADFPRLLGGGAKSSLAWARGPRACCSSALLAFRPCCLATRRSRFSLLAENCSERDRKRSSISL